MKSYKLTNQADSDLEKIFTYGLKHFGADQSLRFLQDLTASFESISTHPEYHQRIDYIKSGYRRAVFQTYSIFFIERESYIEISRVLRKEAISFELDEKFG